MATQPAHKRMSLLTAFPPHSVLCPPHRKPTIGEGKNVSQRTAPIREFADAAKIGDYLPASYCKAPQMPRKGIYIYIYILYI
jgi:hypothetical protein